MCPLRLAPATCCSHQVAATVRLWEITATRPARTSDISLTCGQCAKDCTHPKSPKEVFPSISCCSHISKFISRLSADPQDVLRGKAPVQAITNQLYFCKTPSHAVLAQSIVAPEPSAAVDSFNAKSARGYHGTACHLSAHVHAAWQSNLPELGAWQMIDALDSVDDCKYMIICIN